MFHLSFLKYSVSNLTEFKRQLCLSIYQFARNQNLDNVIEDKEPNVYISNLFNAMRNSEQLVLLIDEYDCQLTANINNPELYEKFRTCMREFYAALKGAKQIKFMAVTGVTRLKDVSIFSVGSDIRDLSYEHAFSQMIGFTREEIKKFYIDYLKLGVSYEKGIDVTDVTDAEIEDLLSRMAEHYDGYCFDRFYENKVFSTYSVNNFLQSIANDKRVVFGDYWYEAGGIPSILRNYLSSHDIDLKKFLESSEIEISYDDFMNPTTLPDMNENVLMCQTGYLTLKSEIENPFNVVAGLANKEVRVALNSLLTLKLFNTEQSPYFGRKNTIIEKGSVEEIVGLLNSVLAAVAYDKYPITSEAVLRALLQMYLTGMKYDVRIEQHNFKGRSDIQINFAKRRVVMELKFSADGKNADRLLEEGLEQIKSRQYGIENLEGQELLRLACVFNASEKIRQITSYQAL